MSVIDEPRASGSFAELDAYLDERVAALRVEVPDRPIVLARRGLCPRCREPIPRDGPDAPVGMTAAQLIKAGGTACLCKHCGFPLRRWKRRRRNAPTCRDCGESVPEADDAVESVTCALCLLHRAELLKAGKLKQHGSKLPCVDCRAPLPLGRQRTGRCEKCRKKRRKESWRLSKRKAKQHSTPSPAQTRINTGRNDRDLGPVGSRADRADFGPLGVELDHMAEALYIPDNCDLARVLNGLPPGLRNYREHGMLLLHFIAVKRWGREVESCEFARLHSTILRGYIPNAKLGPLKRHFAASGVIETVPYSAGHFSTGYRIGPGFDGPPRRVVLTNPRLIRKLREWQAAYCPSDSRVPESIIDQRRDVLDHMLGDLARLGLAKPAAEVLRDLAFAGVDPGHARYVCSAITHSDHDGVKVDDFGYRVHSIVTHTDAEFRPYLRIDGKPLVELDIANSQPLILAIALKSPDTWTTYVASGQHIGEGPGAAPVRLLPATIPVEELRKFTRLCENGEIYEFLMAEGSFDDRETVKLRLFRDVLFGQPYVNGPITEVFARHWPTCLKLLRETKRAYGHKVVAQALQRLESAIIIDGVCGRLVREHPDTHFVTIHDSALAVADSAGPVRRIMREEFERRGVRATVREKKREKVLDITSRVG